MYDMLALQLPLTIIKFETIICLLTRDEQKFPKSKNRKAQFDFSTKFSAVNQSEKFCGFDFGFGSAIWDLVNHMVMKPNPKLFFFKKNIKFYISQV